MTPGEAKALSEKNRRNAYKIKTRHDGTQLDKSPFYVSHRELGKWREVSDKVLRFYGRRAGPKMKESLLRAYRVGRDNPTDARAELAILRSTVEERFALLSEIIEADFKDEKQKRSCVIEMQSAVTAACEDAIRTCERIARINATFVNGLDPEALTKIVQQFNQLIFTIFDEGEPLPGDDESTADRKRIMQVRLKQLDKALDEELQLPSLKNKGTHITPDRIVTAMDASIPYVPEEVE